MGSGMSIHYPTWGMSWAGSWGQSWGPIEVDDGVISRGANPWMKKKQLNDDEEVLAILKEILPVVMARQVQRRAAWYLYRPTAGMA